MKTTRLITHGSPAEAYAVLLFLDELRDAILADYGNEIAANFRQQQQEAYLTEFEDDIIPF